MPRRKQDRLVIAVIVGAVVFSLVMAGAMAVGGLLMGPVRVETAARRTPEPTKPPIAGEERAVQPSGMNLRAEVVGAARKTMGTSARLRMTVHVASRGDPFTVTVRGRWDGRRDRGEMRIDVPGVSGTLRQIVMPNAVYVRTVDVAGAPASWVRVDHGNLLAAGGSSTAADPAALVATLLAVQDKVAIDGTARVRGNETIVYVGETDLRSAARRMPIRERRTMRAMLPGLRDASVPFTAFVDDRGRLVHLSETVSLVTRHLGALVARMRIDFFDFGTKVKVKAPGLGRVADEVVR